MPREHRQTPILPIERLEHVSGESGTIAPRLLEKTSLAQFLLYRALYLPIGQLAHISCHLSICCVKSIPVRLLIPHFLLHVLFYVPDVIIFFHLQFDQICFLFS